MFMFHFVCNVCCWFIGMFCYLLFVFFLYSFEVIIAEFIITLYYVSREGKSSIQKLKVGRATWYFDGWKECG